jgi:hypothetical protein
VLNVSPAKKVWSISFDGDEPDGDNSFGDDFAEAMEDLDNDNEQRKEPGSSHFN